MKRFVLVVILLSFFIVISARAASTCYSDKYYPAVVRLEETKNGFIAYLGGKFKDIPKNSSYSDDIKLQDVPSIICFKDGRFKLCMKYADCKSEFLSAIRDEDDPRLGAIVDITLTREEAKEMRPELKTLDFDWGVDQNITASFADDASIWFGLGFYEGEGIYGVGGFGRYDRTTKKSAIIRPSLIFDSSINTLCFDGESLWFGTYHSWECIGTPPANGLVRYEWKTGKIQSYEGTDDGPCGFLIKDLLKEDDYLWVATDLGLSRWDYGTRKWEHFVPTPDKKIPMQCTTCESIYNELLGTLGKVKDDPRECNNFGSYYEQLTHELEKFRPRFLRKYLLSKPPKEWIGSDLAFLARGSKDFTQLNKEVLSRREISSNDHLIIKGFEEKKCVDPGWRDYLISVALADKGFENMNWAFGSLCQFEGDEKVGRIGLDFLEKQQPGKTGCINFDLALTLLTKNYGRKSVPILFKLLERFRHDGTIFVIISRNLDRVTNNKITGGLKFNCFLDDKIPASFSPEKAYSDWMKWWEAHKVEYSDP